jgi:hypothetical protein
VPRRIGHLVAGFGGLAMAAAVGQLWAAEPGELPPQTRIAFTGDRHRDDVGRLRGAVLAVLLSVALLAGIALLLR